MILHARQGNEEKLMLIYILFSVFYWRWTWKRSQRSLQQRTLQEYLHLRFTRLVSAWWRWLSQVQRCWSPPSGITVAESTVSSSLNTLSAYIYMWHNQSYHILLISLSDSAMLLCSSRGGSLVSLFTLICSFINSPSPILFHSYVYILFCSIASPPRTIHCRVDFTAM